MDIYVHATMRDGVDKGYDCLLISDVCGATIEGIHDARIEMMEWYFERVVLRENYLMR